MVHDFLRGTFITRLNRLKIVVLFLIIGLVSSFLQLRWRPVFNGLLTVLFCTGYLATSFYILQTERLWIPTLSVILPFLLSYAVFGIDAYIQTEKKRRELKKAFSHYLSPAILETVLYNPENLKLGSEKVEATILFSDIANFTKMSEMMPPEEVSRMLNRYFDEMVKIVFQYNGTVDKFIGDAVMAFWGPLLMILTMH